MDLEELEVVVVMMTGYDLAFRGLFPYMIVFE
jgi:hypothetical protein